MKYYEIRSCRHKSVVARHEMPLVSFPARTVFTSGILIFRTPPAGNSFRFPQLNDSDTCDTSTLGSRKILITFSNMEGDGGGGIMLLPLKIKDFPGLLSELQL